MFRNKLQETHTLVSKWHCLEVAVLLVQPSVVWWLVWVLKQFILTDIMRLYGTLASRSWRQLLILVIRHTWDFLILQVKKNVLILSKTQTLLFLVLEAKSTQRKTKILKTQILEFQWPSQRPQSKAKKWRDSFIFQLLVLIQTHTVED